MELRGHGIGIDLPLGWEGEVYRRGEQEWRTMAAGETARTITHLANFPLPPRRGDYGSGAVEIMRTGDVLVVLFEFEPESAGTALFAQEGIPTVKAADFDPNRLQRTLPGQAGIQYFFNTQGRAFCLYVVLGNAATAQSAAAQVNELLGGLDVESL